MPVVQRSLSTFRPSLAPVELALALEVGRPGGQGMAKLKVGEPNSREPRTFLSVVNRVRQGRVVGAGNEQVRMKGSAK